MGLSLFSGLYLDLGYIFKIGLVEFADELINTRNVRKEELKVLLSMFLTGHSEDRICHSGGKVCRKSGWKIRSFGWP